MNHWIWPALVTGCCLALSAFGKEAAMQGAVSDKFKRTMDTTFVTEEGCVVEQFRIHSCSMERDIKAVVVLPPAYQTDSKRQFPILYTLHGHGAPYDTWAQMPKLRAQLKDKPFMYTCFDGDNGSMYIDAQYPLVTARKGDPDTTKKKSLFTTFFFDEFIPAVDAWYRVDGTRRGLTGFSMGGFGALHYALVHPELFTAVSGLSSAFFCMDSLNNDRQNRLAGMLGPLEGNRPAYEAIDHYQRLAALKKKGVAIPPIYQHCGTEDFLLAENRRMKAHLDSLGIPVEYVETPGEHNWKFWHPASVGVAEFHWKYFQAAGKKK